MAHKYLTTNEAIDCCIEYWSGDKIRHIHGKRDVDPRRVYGVLDGDEHVGTREKALDRLRQDDPSLANLVATYGWRYRAQKAA